jgi:hypothetical protein
MRRLASCAVGHTQGGNFAMADRKNSAGEAFTSWRDWVAQSEAQVNKILNEVMGTEGYTRVLGGLTKVLVSMQKNSGEALERYFSALSLPTRKDVFELGQRLSLIESRLTAMEAILGRLAGGGLSTGGGLHAAAPRPPRTRKPSSVKGSGR